MIQRDIINQRLSAAVEYNGQVYLSGLVCEDTSLDIKEQARVIFQRIDNQLIKAGTHKSNILWAQVWLADMANYDAFNEIWDSWIDGSNPPVRACVEAKLAKPGYAVEVMVIAARAV